jgi:hypothetical protein
MDVEAAWSLERVWLYHLSSVSTKRLPTCLSFRYWYHTFPTVDVTVRMYARHTQYSANNLQMLKRDVHSAICHLCQTRVHGC